MILYIRIEQLHDLAVDVRTRRAGRKNHRRRISHGEHTGLNNIIITDWHSLPSRA